MFERRFQTYWADADSAGIVFFPHFFRFFEQAEEELFRTAGGERQRLLESNHVWLPRVEVFTKFSKRVPHRHAIPVRLTPHTTRETPRRPAFDLLDTPTAHKPAGGHH